MKTTPKNNNKYYAFKVSSLIPRYEYNESDAKNNIVSFSFKKTNLAKYINFFSAINDRVNSVDDE